jgi:hypothetical protein
VTEPVAIFLLGCLCAALVALLTMPLVWKRGAAVARRKAEADLPQSLDEIQADKDRLRAEFAMGSRRLEMALQEERDKSAAKAQEVGRITERFREVDAERAKVELERTRLTVENTELWARCEKAEEIQAELREEIGQLTENLSGTEKRLLETRDLHDGSSLAASEKKIELTAREAELAAMQHEVQQAAREKRLSDQRMKDMEASRLMALGAASEEKARAAEVDGKNTRMLGILADRDEALARRERDVERLRAQIADANASEQKLSMQVTALLAEKAKLETQLADQTRRSQAGAANGEADRARLEERLATLLRENRRLRGAGETAE